MPVFPGVPPGTLTTPDPAVKRAVGSVPHATPPARAKASPRASSRRGNPTLRAVLVECAHAAVRTRGCQFHSCHEAVKSRRGCKRAVVATAHKMLRVIYAMLRDGTPHDDPGIDCEAIAIDRKAARWLQKLERYGFVVRPGKEGDTAMHAPHARPRRRLTPQPAHDGPFRGARSHCRPRTTATLWTHISP